MIRIFTEKFGLKSFLVRSGGGLKNNLTPLFQPFTIVDFSAVSKDQRGLWQLKDLRMAIPFVSIPFDPIKASVVLFLNEIVHKTIADDYENEALYHFLEHSLQFLDHKERVGNFHLWFLMQLSRYYGFFPLRINPSDGYFDLAQGITASLRPAHPHYLQGDWKEVWAKFAESSVSDADAIKLTGEGRHYLLDLILLYFRLHLDEMREIKSLEVLRQMYSS